MSKPAWKSKTEIINAAVAILTIAEMTLAKGFIPIPPQTQVMILAIVNAVLRWFTHDSVTIKGENNANT